MGVRVEQQKPQKHAKLSSAKHRHVSQKPKRDVPHAAPRRIGPRWTPFDVRWRICWEPGRRLPTGVAIGRVVEGHAAAHAAQHPRGRQADEAEGRQAVDPNETPPCGAKNNPQIDFHITVQKYICPCKQYESMQYLHRHCSGTGSIHVSRVEVHSPDGSNDCATAQEIQEILWNISPGQSGAYLVHRPLHFQQ